MKIKWADTLEALGSVPGIQEAPQESELLLLLLWFFVYCKILT